MNPTEIEFAIRDLVAKPYDGATFPYDFIGIHNASKMTVSRLKSGQTNASKLPGDLLWKKHFYFRSAQSGADVGAIADAILVDPLVAKHKPRFVVVTNGEQVHARDLQLDDTLNIEYAHLDERSDFFLPLAGYERRALVEEHPADIKAAKKLKKLYDAILAANPTWSSGHHTHELNLLMTRLLFCFYAEKTGIFDTPKIFSNTLTQHTSEDGGEVAPLLHRLFCIMNIEDGKRSTTAPAIDLRFPYVNGSLFEDMVEIPHFNRTARRQLLECGDLDWTTINPDIFGSMIQTIAQDGTRSDLGMHYTSVPNIMKVLQPLFLDDLHEAFEDAKGSVPKLEALLGRLSRIRVFDPACGSGNFLIIAYKALRTLEIQIFTRIGDIASNAPLRLSGISLEHFYGIDVVDFASETAKLSLWIAEHQMNTAFERALGTVRAALPLGKIKTIHCGNATRLDWQVLCPHNPIFQTYICGNPPYQGSVGQTAEQKQDITAIFSPFIKAYKDVDYVSCWFIKLADYISENDTTVGAFVSTNSICQGEQIPFLWPYVFKRGLCISFAHTSFKWANNASHNAGVSCVVVGLSTASLNPKHLYTDSHRAIVANINPYLVPSTVNTIVSKRSTPLSAMPQATLGNKPNDSGHLVLSTSERNRLVEAYPQSRSLIRRFYGTKEIIHNFERYVLWIDNDKLSLAKSVPPIAQRIAKTRESRIKGGIQARGLVDSPHRFAFISYRIGDALVIPETSSERRQYLQISLISDGEIANQTLYVVYSPPPHLLAVLSSRLHRLWTSAVGGKLEDRLRYSNGLVYNTFPVPELSVEQKRILRDHSKAILKARSKHPGKTIAWLYNPETMPENLIDAHHDNDAYLEERVYGRKFKDDTQRLEHLFAMYARLIHTGERDETLFDKEAQAV